MKLFSWMAAGTMLVMRASGCVFTEKNYVDVPEPQVLERTSEAEALINVSWKLVPDSLAKHDEKWFLPHRAITLTCTDQGRYIGFGGVNNYTGCFTFDASRGAIKFGPAMCSRMAGPGLDYENCFLQQLQAVDNYRVIGCELELRQGTTVLAKLINADNTPGI